MAKKKMGRPVVNGKKDIQLRIRIDEETLIILDDVAQTAGKNRSEYIRELIRKQK